jgi:hypothetical protein
VAHVGFKGVSASLATPAVNAGCRDFAGSPHFRGIPVFSRFIHIMCKWGAHKWLHRGDASPSKSGGARNVLSLQTSREKTTFGNVLKTRKIEKCYNRAGKARLRSAVLEVLVWEGCFLRHREAESRVGFENDGGGWGPSPRGEGGQSLIRGEGAEEGKCRSIHTYVYVGRAKVAPSRRCESIQVRRGEERIITANVERKDDLWKCA